MLEETEVALFAEIAKYCIHVAPVPTRQCGAERESNILEVDL